MIKDVEYKFSRVDVPRHPSTIIPEACADLVTKVFILLVLIALCSVQDIIDPFGYERYLWPFRLVSRHMCMVKYVGMSGIDVSK